MKLFGFNIPNIKNIFVGKKEINNVANNMECETTNHKDLTFTKKIVSFVLISGVLWVWCSYVLAFLGRVDIAENLSSQVVTIILGTGLGYFLKSLIENLSKYHNLKALEVNGATPSTIINNIQEEIQGGMTINIEEDINDLVGNGDDLGSFDENFVDINVNDMGIIEPNIGTNNNNYSDEYQQNKYNDYIKLTNEFNT